VGAARGNLVYRPGLDGVRAVAVVGVLLYHGQVRRFSGGFLGVDVFFVLSGFLITSLLLNEHTVTGTVNLVRFWLGRVRRLLPAALLVIAVSLLVTAVFFRPELGRLRGDALASTLYVNNWHQILVGRSYFEHAGRPSLLQHFWSLAVEEQFYLLWPPLLLLAFTRLRRQVIAWLALCAALASALLMVLLFHSGGDQTRIYYGTDTRATPILIGVVLAFVWPAMRSTKEVNPNARRVLGVVGAVGLLGILLGMMLWTSYDPFIYHGGLLLTAFASALLVASAAHPASSVGKLLGTPPLVWIGARSYGIYLWHWPVMALTRPGVDVRASLWVLVPLQLALTLVLATLSYRYVEIPVRRGEMQLRIRSWLTALAPSQRQRVLAATPALLAFFVIAIAVLPAQARHVPVGPTASAAARAAPAIHATRHERQVLAVGASVMLQAHTALEHRIHIKIDAADSRQPDTILDRLKAYRAHNALPPVVVVQTGENSPLTDHDLRALKDVLSGVPHVVIVNLRYAGADWIDSTNTQLAQLVAGWPQATLADWNAASSDPTLLWDGAHPNERGQRVYAETIAKAVDRALPR
jgi:peptidoglycan/LPS O-acetylase OafA/YrhL